MLSRAIFHRPTPHQAGFTLIELLITLAIVVIAGTVVLPMTTSIVRGSHLTTETNTLVRDLNYARTEAVKRGSRITICGTIDGATCSHTGWANGWMIFIDDAGQIGNVDGNDEIMVRRPKAARDITLDSGTSYVVFNGTGNSSYAFDDSTKNVASPFSLASNAGKAIFPIQTIIASLIPTAQAAVTATTSCIASTALQTTSASAVCNGTSLTNYSQASFLVCDASRHAEKGNLLTVMASGRISHSRVVCD